MHQLIAVVSHSRRSYRGCSSDIVCVFRASGIELSSEPVFIKQNEFTPTTSAKTKRQRFLGNLTRFFASATPSGYKKHRKSSSNCELENLFLTVSQIATIGYIVFQIYMYMYIPYRYMVCSVQIECV